MSLHSKDLPTPPSYVTLGADNMLLGSSLTGELRTLLPVLRLSPTPREDYSTMQTPHEQHTLALDPASKWDPEGTWLSLLIQPQPPEDEGAEPSLPSQSCEDSHLLQG